MKYKINQIQIIYSKRGIKMSLKNNDIKAMSNEQLIENVKQLNLDIQPYRAVHAGSYGKRFEGISASKGKPQLNGSLRLSLARCMTELKKRNVIL